MRGWRGHKKNLMGVDHKDREKQLEFGELVRWRKPRMQGCGGVAEARWETGGWVSTTFSEWWPRAKERLANRGLNIFTSGPEGDVTIRLVSKDEAIQQCRQAPPPQHR